jgi:splicing factor 3B subunit 3
LIQLNSSLPSLQEYDADCEPNRIFTLPKLGSKVKTEALPLTYTPRKLIFHPKQHILYTIESDHRTLSPSEQESQLANVVDSAPYRLDTRQFGLPRAPAGSWASCIRAVDVRMQENATLAQIHLDNNEAAFSIAVVPFAARGHELHLVVGTAKDTLLMPRTCTTGYLRTYLIKNEGAELEFLHSVRSSSCASARLTLLDRGR